MSSSIENRSMSKQDWLTSRECVTQAWLTLRADATAPGEAARFRMEQGIEVHDLAHERFPDGLFVQAPEGMTPADATRSVLEDDTASVLFEPTFAAGQFIARADVLRRTDDGWEVIEVKSSFADTSKLDEYIEDLAYTVTIARKAGLGVARASLMLLSREYRHGDDSGRLFEEVDVTSDVMSLVDEAERELEAVEAALTGDARPTPRLVPACRSCPHFEDQCLGAGVAHSVFELPRLHKTKVEQLSGLGVVSLGELPDTFQLTNPQQRALDAVTSGEPRIEAGLGDALGVIEWPCHYLDFETVATVLPLYPGRGCYEQILTQFSVHRCDAPGQVVGHDEFLADASVESERELAEALIAALRTDGSILVYSSFEKTRIKGLIKRFPDLTEPLEAILARIVDLLQIVSKQVYHPEFRGSASIKSVLPALVPELSYDDLDVADGDTAIARFARMARGEIEPSEMETVRRSLLNYCERDTEAMVRLHEALVRLSDENR